MNFWQNEKILILLIISFIQTEWIFSFTQAVHTWIDNYLYSCKLDEYNYSEEGSKLGSTLGLTLMVQYWVRYWVKYQGSILGLILGLNIGVNIAFQYWVLIFG